MTDWSPYAGKSNEELKSWKLLGFKWTRWLAYEDLDYIIEHVDIRGHIDIKIDDLRDDLAICASDYFMKIEFFRSSRPKSKEKERLNSIIKAVGRIDKAIAKDFKRMKRHLFIGCVNTGQYDKQEMLKEWDLLDPCKSVIHEEIVTALQYINKLRMWASYSLQRMDEPTNIEKWSEHNEWLFGRALWDIYTKHFQPEFTNEKARRSRVSDDAAGPYFRFARAFADKYEILTIDGSRVQDQTILGHITNSGVIHRINFHITVSPGAQTMLVA